MKDWSGKLACTLLGCVISLLALGATAVSKDEVSSQISLESPYVQDRSLLLYRLKQIEIKLDRLLALE